MTATTERPRLTGLNLSSATELLLPDSARDLPEALASANEALKARIQGVHETTAERNERRAQLEHARSIDRQARATAVASGAKEPKPSEPAARQALAAAEQHCQAHDDAMIAAERELVFQLQSHPEWIEQQRDHVKQARGEALALLEQLAQALRAIDEQQMLCEGLMRLPQPHGAVIARLSAPPEYRREVFDRAIAYERRVDHGLTVTTEPAHLVGQLMRWIDPGPEAQPGRAAW